MCAEQHAQRLAVPGDVPQIAELMRSSILTIFPRFYDELQTTSAAVHIAQPDLALIEDGTYFVRETDDEIVACGGWSRRNKLYTGSGVRPGDSRLLDAATEPARVRAMFVRADLMRRGMGRAILETCEQAARAEAFTNSHCCDAAGRAAWIAPSGSASCGAPSRRRQMVSSSSAWR